MADAQLRPARPTILSTDHINRAIADDNFYTLMPEFLTVKKKLEASHTPAVGCQPCQKRRAAIALSSDFVSILNTLSDDRLQVLKRYIGVPRLIIRAVNKQTGRVEGKEV